MDLLEAHGLWCFNTWYEISTSPLVTFNIMSTEAPWRNDIWVKLWKWCKRITCTSRGRKNNAHAPSSRNDHYSGTKVSAVLGKIKEARESSKAWGEEEEVGDQYTPNDFLPLPTLIYFYLIQRYIYMRHIWGIYLYPYISTWQNEPLNKFPFVLAASSHPDALSCSLDGQVNPY